VFFVFIYGCLLNYLVVRVLELFNTCESSFLFSISLKLMCCVFCFWMFVQFQLPCSILDNQALCFFLFLCFGMFVELPCC